MTDLRAQRANTLIGATLGSYQITGVLGVGGMGAVFRARHEILERDVAVKVLRSELTANEDLVQRFLTEARAATQILHPGIIQVFDFGYTDDGRAYLVMELLEGEPLSTKLARHKQLAEVEVILLLRQVASALTAAHSRGVVHRDLKPDNVFLVVDPQAPGGERPKVLDFGIAKLLDSPDANHTQTGALMGTPLYMAPEQAIAARAIDPRADLYSLGCMVYEMLVGEPPFVAEGAGEIIAMQMFSVPVPVSQRVSVSPALETIVMRLLEKEPDARFQTAMQLVDALDAINVRPSAQFQPTILPEGARSSEIPGQPFSAEPPVDQAAMSALLNLNRIELPPREPDKPEPGRRNAMPIIAAAITVGLAAVVIVIVFARGGSEPSVATQRDAGVAEVPGELPPIPGTPSKATTASTPGKASTPPKPVDHPPVRPSIKPGEKTAGVTRAKEPGARPVKSPGTVPASSGPITSPDRDLHTDNNSPIEVDVGTTPSVPSPPVAPPPDKPPDPAPAPAP